MSVQMHNLTEQEVAVKQAIEELIQTATTYDVAALERIYHDDLQVLLLDHSGELTYADKEGFKSLFQNKKDEGAPPMNTWSRFHHVEVNNERAHVLLSRKNDLSGSEQLLSLSIDLKFENSVWQVIREVIFLQPVDG